MFSQTLKTLIVAASLCAVVPAFAKEGTGTVVGGRVNDCLRDAIQSSLSDTPFLEYSVDPATIRNPAHTNIITFSGTDVSMRKYKGVATRAFARSGGKETCSVGPIRLFNDKEEQVFNQRTWDGSKRAINVSQPAVTVADAPAEAN